MQCNTLTYWEEKEMWIGSLIFYEGLKFSFLIRMKWLLIIPFKWDWFAFRQELLEKLQRKIYWTLYGALLFGQLDIASTWHCIHLPKCKAGILSNYHFIKLKFYHFAFFEIVHYSTCHFAKLAFFKLAFCALDVLSTCHFIKLSFW